MASLASTHGRGGGTEEATNVSSGGECGGEGWALTSGVAPLSWWFSGGSVSALASSRISNLSMREKSTVGHAIASSLPSVNSFISSSSLMCPTRSGVLDELVGDFSADST